MMFRIEHYPFQALEYIQNIHNLTFVTSCLSLGTGDPVSQVSKETELKSVFK